MGVNTQAGYRYRYGYGYGYGFWCWYLYGETAAKPPVLEIADRDKVNW
ncbi:hypothetical protein [Arthrobacter methylotrophus]|uniref:Uncharacterized protein n=1 Tax=Arthrobacter methylotrophus TaxID=121291 RepID=A0ABV5UTH4_9MICC